MTKTSENMYDYISSKLSQGMKVAVPEAILDQENLSLDEMSAYFIVQRGSFGLVNFRGFRRVL